MGHMKDLDRRIRQGGDDAIAAVGELLTGFALRTLPKGYEMTITPQPWISVRYQTPDHDVPVLVWFPKTGKKFTRDALEAVTARVAALEEETQRCSRDAR